MTLEDTLFVDIRAGNQIELERALLIASGCDTEEKVARYKAQISRLDKKCRCGFPGHLVKQDSVSVGEIITKVLWKEKIKEYSKMHFGLKELLDTGIGNCISIHALFSALYLRQRKDIVAYIQDDHFMPGIQLPYDSWIPIDITIKNQFESRFKKPAKEYSLFNGVVGTTLNSKAIHECGKQNFLEAEKYALAAIKLVPDLSNPHAILGAISYEQGNKEEARQWIRKAEEYLHPHSELRSMINKIREKYGDLQDAEERAIYTGHKGDSQ